MKKIIILLTIIILSTCIGGGLYYYHNYLNTSFNIEKTVYIYVDEKDDYNSVRQLLIDSAKINNIDVFDKLAKLKSYKEVKTGKYAITKQDDAKSVLNKLQFSYQVPVRVTFNNMRLKSNLTERISEQLMFSKEDLDKVLNDSFFCAKYQMDTASIVSIFIPNTYEFYWNITPEKFVDKMYNEYKKFWTEDRLNKAKKINLTPLEVSSLAAIVEEECYLESEYPIVAGLYLNRLNKGMPLQADPTLKFAAGDFSLKRILNKHKEIDSPYNTYLNKGLPPSPIRIPSIKGIDAVLNPDNNNYLYMCAKDDLSGAHSFETNLKDHNKNALKYHNALNDRKIY